jgi:hypothetical protein
VGQCAADRSRTVSPFVWVMCSKLKRTNAGGEKCVWDGFEFCHEFLDDFFKICRQCDSTTKNNVSRSAVGRMSARKNQVLRIQTLFDGSEFFVWNELGKHCMQAEKRF